MDVGSTIRSHLRIKEFFFVRGSISGQDATPLYQCHVTGKDYSELLSVLSKSLPEIDSLTCPSYWPENYQKNALLHCSGFVRRQVNDDRSAIGIKLNSRVLSGVRSKSNSLFTAEFSSNKHRNYPIYFERDDVDY
jgi:hypothetical protein